MNAAERRTKITLLLAQANGPLSATASKRGTAVGLLLRLFRKIFAVHRYLTATHIGYSPQARHRVNCPKVKRRSSVGYPHRTTRSSVGTADGTYELQLLTNFTVGCGKVNCPKGKRRCPGVRPRRTVFQPSAHCLTAGAASGRPRNAQSLQNSYLLTPNSYLA